MSTLNLALLSRILTGACKRLSKVHIRGIPQLTPVPGLLSLVWDMGWNPWTAIARNRMLSAIPHQAKEIRSSDNQHSARERGPVCS